MLALLVSTVTAVATLAPPVTAQGAVPGRDAFTATFAHLARQARLKASAKAPRRNLAAVATHHVLAMDAAASRVSINRLRAEWQLVAICEVGGNWSMIGSAYSGIGFLNTTWAQYGGTKYAPLAGEASMDQQILVGMKVTHGWVPDQYGCSSGGW